MNPNSLSGEDKLWGASVVQGKFEYLREVKGVFKNWPYEKQEVSPRGAASTIVLCQELGSRSVVISPHVQVYSKKS